MGLSTNQLVTAGATYGYVTFWILSSAFVILYNKWILTVWGFAFPITLTMWHMAFCSIVAAALVRACSSDEWRPRVKGRSLAAPPPPPFSLESLTPRRPASPPPPGAVRHGAKRQHDPTDVLLQRRAYWCVPGVLPKKEALKRSAEASYCRTPASPHANRRAVLRHPVVRQRQLHVLERELHPDVEGAHAGSRVHLLSRLGTPPAYICFSPRSSSPLRADSFPLSHASHLQGVEKRKTETMYIMAVISAGVCIASYGELAFDLTGVLFQLASILTESNRIVLVQILLQSKGVKLNPITSMYYISPCCLVFLSIPWLALEYPKLKAMGGSAGAGAGLTAMVTSSSEATLGRVGGAAVGRTNWLDGNGISIFVTNASAAFTLNCAVFLLIGKSSALTMNIAGVVKDWLLIYLSWVIFSGPITPLNLFGYGIAFCAVCYYNYMKLRGMSDENVKKQGTAGEDKDAELQSPGGLGAGGEDAAAREGETGEDGGLRKGLRA